MIMSTIALWSPGTATSGVATKSKPSLFGRLVKAREKEAMRRIHTFLITQSDARLQDLGYTAEEIAELRAGRIRMPS